MKSFLLFISICILFQSNPLAAIETWEDEKYIYTKQTWNEIAAQEQRLLMKYFEQKLSNLIEEWGIPSFWNKNIQKIFLGNQDRFSGYLSEAESLSSAYASSCSIGLEDFIPTGFIVGFGMNIDGAVVIGIGGSVLITFIVVPIGIEMVDKITGESTFHYEASWSIGGFAQQGVGLGAGAGVSVHGAIGLIWGPLPDAAALQGPAVGISVNVAKYAGIGFKGAFIFNTITKQDNLIALLTYNIGAGENATVQASAFYFISGKELLKSLNIGVPWVINSVESITEKMLQELF